MALPEGTCVPSRRSRAKSYLDGYRYCSRCAIFLLTNSVRCPYCGGPLRMRPRKGRDEKGPLKAVSAPDDVLREAEKIRVRLLARSVA
jgi:hypothetical protein